MKERSSGYNGACYDNGSEPKDSHQSRNKGFLALAYQILSAICLPLLAVLFKWFGFFSQFTLSSASLKLHNLNREVQSRNKNLRYLQSQIFLMLYSMTWFVFLFFVIFTYISSTVASDGGRETQELTQQGTV